MVQGCPRTTLPAVRNEGEPIRVALVTPLFPVDGKAVVGGVEGVCLYLAQALAQQPGVQLEVFVPCAESYGITEYTRVKRHGLTIHAAPSRFRRLGGLGIALVNPEKMLRFAASHPSFDVIHVQNIAPWAAKCRLPCVLTVHGIDERDALFRGGRWSRKCRSFVSWSLHGRARRQVRNVIAISPYVAQFLANKAQRVWNIENPVSECFFGVSRRPAAGRLFCSGSIIPRKNIAGLIEALASSTFNGWELAIAGKEVDPSYSAHCRQVASRLNISHRVRFLGPLSIPLLLEELGRAAVFVLTSIQETAPLVIAEAMAAGVPVLGPNVCGVPWMVSEGVTGRLVDPLSRDDIRRGLELLLGQDDLAEMGRRAKSIAQERFRDETVARRTVDVYRQIREQERSAAANTCGL